MKSPVRQLLAVLLFASAIAVLPASAAPNEQIFIYRRIFKSSVPEFIQLKIPSGSGQPTYDIRQLDEEPGDTRFEISDSLRAKVFSLITELNYFRGLDLDVHRKIANLGEKTFAWTDGANATETKFNYTLNAPANQLMQICEGIARQQQITELLQRRIKYDRLGVNDALIQFEADLNKGELPEPARLLPLLDQISGDSRFVEIARQRARALAERLRHS